MIVLKLLRQLGAFLGNVLSDFLFVSILKFLSLTFIVYLIGHRRYKIELDIRIVIIQSNGYCKR